MTMANKKKKIQRIEYIENNTTSAVNNLLNIGWEVKFISTCSGIGCSQSGTSCYVVLETLVDA